MKKLGNSPEKSKTQTLDELGSILLTGKIQINFTVKLTYVKIWE